MRTLAISRSPLPAQSLSLTGDVNSRRAAADLDRTGLPDVLAVEGEDLDFLLDHALRQQGLAVPAPRHALAPLSGLAICDRRQPVLADAEHAQQTKIVVERGAFRLVGPILHGDGDEIAIRGDGQTLRCLPHR